MQPNASKSKPRQHSSVWSPPPSSTLLSFKASILWEEIRAWTLLSDRTPHNHEQMRIDWNDKSSEGSCIPWERGGVGEDWSGFEIRLQFKGRVPHVRLQVIHLNQPIRPNRGPSLELGNGRLLRRRCALIFCEKRPELPRPNQLYWVQSSPVTVLIWILWTNHGQARIFPKTRRLCELVLPLRHAIRI